MEQKTKQKSETGQDQDVTQETQGRTHIHNVHFYNLTPRSILCMAYSKLCHKLALSRNDSSIEIWDMQHAPFLEKTIPKAPGNSVEGLAWSGDRLFSVGLSGEIVEWNMQTMEPLFRQFATGNSIWCLDVNGTGNDLAIGTEEGYINLFDISDRQLMYKTLFDKQEGRILCCKFDARGEFLVTGSIGAIRIWDVKSGHALHKMSMGRAEKKVDVIVWSLQVLQDFTIISGDSRGQICVWDGKTASFIESHQVLAADVLAVVVNEAENLVICSGIEPIIRIYAKAHIKRDDMRFHRWVKFLQRNVHDHDVKALISVGDRIFSGGMDAYLGISSSSKMRSDITKYGPFLQNPCVAVAPSTRLLILRYTNYLEIWRVGSSKGDKRLQTVSTDEEKSALDKQNKLLHLDVPPMKLLELKSRGEEPIVCAAISPDGRWLCYSTQKQNRLFRFEAPCKNKNDTLIWRIKLLPKQFTAATQAQFSSDSKQLFLVNGLTKQILIFTLLPNGSTDVDFSECIEVGKHIKDAINMLHVSNCGNYVVAAGTCRTIAVWRIFKGKHFKHHLNLPRYTAATTALALHSELPRLVAAFSDGKIFEYDLEEMCFTCSDKDYFVSSSEAHCVRNIVMDKRNSAMLILQNDANLFVLEKCASDSAIVDEESMADGDSNNHSKKHKSAKKLKRVISDPKISCLRLKFEKSYEHLIHLAALNAQELVTVSVNPISLIEQLPDAFKQKKFGTA